MEPHLRRTWQFMNRPKIAFVKRRLNGSSVWPPLLSFWDPPEILRGPGTDIMALKFVGITPKKQRNSIDPPHRHGDLRDPKGCRRCGVARHVDHSKLARRDIAASAVLVVLTRIRPCCCRLADHVRQRKREPPSEEASTQKDRVPKSPFSLGGKGDDSASQTRSPWILAGQLLG